MLRRWQFWLGFLISAIFLYISLRGLKLDEVWEYMSSAQYVWLIPGVAVYFIGVWVRTWRWHYMLRPLKDIPTRTMFPIVTIGYMGNNIFPARAGEVLRAVMLKQREDVPISASLATDHCRAYFRRRRDAGFRLPQSARTGADDAAILVLSAIDIRTLAIIGSAMLYRRAAGLLLAAMFPRTAESLYRPASTGRSAALSRQKRRAVVTAFPVRAGNRCVPLLKP